MLHFSGRILPHLEVKEYYADILYHLKGTENSQSLLKSHLCVDIFYSQLGKHSTRLNTAEQNLVPNKNESFPHSLKREIFTTQDL